MGRTGLLSITIGFSKIEYTCICYHDAFMGKPGKWLSRIGPGAIVASATVGAGETVLAVRAGAWGGYDLLWLILLAILAKSLLTLYLLGHYTVVTGRAVADKLVDLPGPRGWFLWVVLVLESLVAPFVFVVIAVPCGRLMSQILAGGGWNVSYKWLALAFLALAILVGLVQRYGTLEKSQGLVCLVLLAGTVTATVLARPDFAGILKGLFSLGSVPPYPDWIPPEIKGRSQLLEVSAVFGYAGSIAMNYVVYSNWVQMKGWSLKGVSGGAARKRALGPLKFDVGANAAVVFLVTVAFMVAGAAIFQWVRRLFRRVREMRLLGTAGILTFSFRQWAPPQEVEDQENLTFLRAAQRGSSASALQLHASLFKSWPHWGQRPLQVSLQKILKGSSRTTASQIWFFRSISRVPGS